MIVATQELLLYSVVISCLILSLVSFFKGDNKKVSIPFAVMSFSTAFWALTTFYEEEAIDFSYKLILVKFDFTLAVLISYFFYSFSNNFTNIHKKIFVRWFINILTPIILILSPFSSLIISNINEKLNNEISIIFGFLYPLYLLVLIINFSMGIYYLVIDYVKSTGLRKLQLKYITIGLAITSIITITTNLILPSIFELSSFVPRIGIYSIIIFLAASVISITKHELFNIKVIATEIFVGVLLVVILGRAITSINLSDIIFEVTLLALTGFFGYFLIRSVRDEVSRREEVEKLAGEKIEALNQLEQRTKNLSTLQKISDIVLNESEMRTMTQKILDEIPKQLDGCVGAFLSIVKGKNLAAYSFSQNPVSQKIFSLVGEDLSKYSDPITPKYNLLHDAIIEKNPRDSDSLADFISPPISKPVAKTLQTILNAKHIEALPLYAGGEAFGVLMFVFTEDKDQVHLKNFEISRAIAGDMSLAIQRAQAFQKLKDANEYLAQLDKMKDEFISMASHELNTPLAAIEGYLSMILDEGMGKVDDKSREYLNRAYASSKRLADLILDLLNVSRIEQGRLKMRFAQANIYDMAESVVHELQIKADAKKLALKIDADKAKLPLIWCDPDRIREVFVNLTGNAIKFTEKGSITISIKQDGEKLICSVADTGRGIALEDQKKLFQKFSQVKREVDEHQGTGLGLYISKNFVELHNGTLSVKSAEGKGATFTFELPILKEAPKQVSGAMLEQSVTSPTIQVGDKPESALPNIQSETISKGEVTTAKVV
ncbi:hypothetical protein HY844_01095 [Candidatus Berkelbacteria bacterium]|nr:hypothetical protein [Candidatus Berkelbacteria bacterium]